MKRSFLPIILVYLIGLSNALGQVFSGDPKILSKLETQPGNQPLFRPGEPTKFSITATQTHPGNGVLLFSTAIQGLPVTGEIRCLSMLPSQIIINEPAQSPQDSANHSGGYDKTFLFMMSNQQSCIKAQALFQRPEAKSTVTLLPSADSDRNENHQVQNKGTVQEIYVQAVE